MLRIGDYEILRRLAVGGMAEILVGRRDGSGETRVLKRTLPHLAAVPEVAERLAAEASVLARLHHANIVRSHGIIAADPPALVLEHVAGASLSVAARRARAQGRPVPPEILAAVASALAHAHAAGIVHRDVKSSNVLLSFDGSVKLADFGIAAAGDPAVDARALAALARRLGVAPPAAPPAAVPPSPEVAAWLAALHPDRPPLDDPPADATLPMFPPPALSDNGSRCPS